MFGYRRLNCSKLAMTFPLSQFPATSTPHGAPTRSSESWLRILNNEIGDFRGIPRGNVELSHCVVVSRGRSINSIYAVWNREVLRIGTSVFALMALAAGLAIWLAKELQRRTRAEAKLTTMAMTDGLTGLSNRRRFEELLKIEWQRCLRKNASLALLVITPELNKLFVFCLRV